jgi:hypothetical protein
LQWVKGLNHYRLIRISGRSKWGLFWLLNRSCITSWVKEIKISLKKTLQMFFIRSHNLCVRFVWIFTREFLECLFLIYWQNRYLYIRKSYLVKKENSAPVAEWSKVLGFTALQKKSFHRIFRVFEWTSTTLSSRCSIGRLLASPSIWETIKLTTKYYNNQWLKKHWVSIFTQTQQRVRVVLP